MFYADLHVHSKFSRATSRECDLEHLALWAGRKGITVVGTGDFTHPGWFEEIRQKLVPAEPGLFRLRPELEQAIASQQPEARLADVRFMLQVEISTIYKKAGRTRKVHHLLYAPTLEQAKAIVQSLARIGNLVSDGRPILGLDSRNLLEITLQAGEGAFLVPAHVWTPWFALFGSQSGFDALEECYADLSSEIFALETGLSSDPAMNRRVSQLDRYRLVSNSDAHSPAKLGRETCVFHTPVDYFAMREALRTGQGYGGTLEFFPEEGKYHLDGHRKCGVCLEPDQTRRLAGLCPECGKPLTLGVMYRVCQLADRAEGETLAAGSFRSLIPLDEVLAELLQVGPQSKAVAARYDDLLRRVGPELFILQEAAPEDLARLGSPLLAEAMTRMRSGQVIRQAGYDGEYGVIRLFQEEELHRGAGLLFSLPEKKPKQRAARKTNPNPSSPNAQAAAPRSEPVPSRAADQEAVQTDAIANARGILGQLDPQQRAAAEMVQGPLVILAGPGTGKTRTLTHRLAHLIVEQGAAPQRCLALTFSRRAAEEMAQRLGQLVPAALGTVPVMTFHALGLCILREHASRLGLPDAFCVASQSQRSEMLQAVLGKKPQAAGQLLRRLSRHKRQATGVPVEDADREACDVYHRELASRGWLDFDDLIRLPVQLLTAHEDLREQYRSQCGWVSVDEFQDIDALQYDLLKRLVPPDGNLCVIGDPDQSIYGFRGADAGLFSQFVRDFPAARTVALTHNYRSTQTIVDAALQLIAPASLVRERSLAAEGRGAAQVEIHACATDRAEAEFVVHTIERLLGGSSFFSLDSSRVESHEGQSLSFADIAVLYRTETQAGPLVEALARSGMPFQRRSHDPLIERPAVAALVGRLQQQEQGGDVGERLEQAAAELQAEHADLTLYLPELRRLAAGGGNLAQFLSQLALGADADLWDPRADRVSLLTLHASKGLEFPVVFLVGCEDGVLPLRFGSADEEDLAEERRLFFVGMTRAQQHLLLTHAGKRLWRGKLHQQRRSPFVDDIEARLLAEHQHRAVPRPVKEDRQRTLFDV